jgi:ABC-2 type transport system permease protein
MSIFKKAQPENTEDSGKKQTMIESAAPAATGKGKKGKGVDRRNRSLKRLSVTSTILFLVVILAFNVLFDKLLGSTLKWDWSTGQQYTIGETSQGLLKSMTSDIQIIGLFNKETDTSFKNIQLMLEDYVKKSNGRITVRYVDPDKYPSILTEIDPEGLLGLTAGTFAVYSKATGKAKKISEAEIFDYQYDSNSGQYYLNGVIAEESFTGAIKYVQSEITPVLYFTTGHDEMDYATAFSVLVTNMKNNNFLVKSLELFNLDKIPADCAALIMAAPAKDVTTSESNMMSAYLQGGGSLMVIAGYSNAEFPILNKLLADFNLEISNNKIREGDIGHQYQNDAYKLRAIAPAGKLTTEAIDGFTLMDNVRGMNILSNAKEWITTEAVLTSSAQGVAETKGDVGQSSVPGTQNAAVLSENKGWYDGTKVTQTAKVVLIGSSGIFSDTILQSYGNNIYNFAVFYYSIQWLSNSNAAGDLLIEAKAPVSYNLTSGTQTDYNFTAVLVMIILPVLLLAAALLVYRKRKHL